MARWSKANSTALSSGEPPTGDRPIRPMWAFSSIVPQKWGGGFAFSLAMQKSAVRCTKKGRPNIHQQKHARVGPGQSDVTGTKRALRLITPQKREALCIYEPQKRDSPGPTTSEATENRTFSRTQGGRRSLISGVWETTPWRPQKRTP